MPSGAVPRALAIQETTSEKCFNSHESLFLNGRESIYQAASMLRKTDKTSPAEISSFHDESKNLHLYLRKLVDIHLNKKNN